MTCYWLFLLVGVLAGAFFAFNPWIDILTTQAVYDPEQGFYLSTLPWVQNFYQGIPYLDLTIITLLLLSLVYGFWATYGVPSDFIQRFKGTLFLVFSYAMGPGLVVNFILKEHWGRARPDTTTLFGGDKLFSPAFWISDQCATNCSFVAGHPSTFFFLTALAFLAPWMWQRVVLGTFFLTMGALAGAGRILQGGHFLSDVIFSGFFTILTVWTLWILIYRHHLLERLLPYRYWVLGGMIAALLFLGYFSWDLQIATFFHDHAIPEIEAIHWVSKLGLTLPYLLILGFIVVALHVIYMKTLERWYLSLLSQVLFVLGSICAAGGVVDILKPLLGRARPKLYFEQGLYGFDPLAFKSIFWSFPSGHSSTVFAFATALNILFPRPLLWYSFATTVAITRIVLIEHYLSDVITGASIGVIMTLLFHREFVKRDITYFYDYKRKPQDGSPH